MEQAVLHDAKQFPTEEIIFSYLGKSKALWISFFNSIDSDHSDFSKEWRFYNDGKSWLMKVQRKSKTVFWLSLFKNSFRITFYLTDKAESAINNSTLSNELIEQFNGGKRFGKIRGITILFKKKKDIDFAKELIDIKLSIK